MKSSSARYRALVLDYVMLLADANAQRKYEKDVPNAFVPAELIETFTDIYHPKSADFIVDFTETELKNISILYGLVWLASEKINKSKIHSVVDLQKLPEWRNVMAYSKNLDVILRK